MSAPRSYILFRRQRCRLKDQLAYAHPNPTFAELIEIMADQTLEVIEKKKGLVANFTAAAAMLFG